ncbi:CPBP family intramembrane metalloprotease [Alteromonas sediminis]|uniref:CPBP family intramembrane metalloprotease n=1 Tax=Alteromonas sediminis TaxID=2259342 RepID=A0A3N5Y6A0_9ALTE|nr:type II CAAX endopeptidase family protein [Alteromonas sediminis]RPJ65929.1 CPBP family intramembrane metalloprotease [Alteromonas sediminis]
MNNDLKPLISAVSLLILGIGLFAVMRHLPIPTVPFPALTSGVVMCLLLLGLSRYFVQRDGNTLSSVNLYPNRGTFKRFVVGFTIGTCIAGSMLVALFTTTDLVLTFVNEQSFAMFILASFIIVPLALMEEILFRGYAFFQMTKKLNIRIVILLTAIAFALYHYNENTSLYSVLLGPGIWGVVFGVAAFLSNSVAVPLGIHVAANFSQAIVGMNRYVDPMWRFDAEVLVQQEVQQIESVGLTMQFVLLVGAILILEYRLYKAKKYKLER